MAAAAVTQQAGDEQRSFLLQRVQPAMTGLIDGSLSTLAPIFTVALAHHRGVALPPIDVLKRPDGYYVVDGRHRVSVARTLGQDDIEARVTEVRKAGLSPCTPRRRAPDAPRTTQGVVRRRDDRPTTRTEP